MTSSTSFTATFDFEITLNDKGNYKSHELIQEDIYAAINDDPSYYPDNLEDWEYL